MRETQAERIGRDVGNHRRKGLQKDGTPVQRRGEVSGVETVAPRHFPLSSMKGFPLSVSEIKWTDNTGRGKGFVPNITEPRRIENPFIGRTPFW